MNGNVTMAVEIGDAVLNQIDSLSGYGLERDGTTLKDDVTGTRTIRVTSATPGTEVRAEAGSIQGFSRLVIGTEDSGNYLSMSVSGGFDSDPFAGGGARRVSCVCKTPSWI